MEDQEWLNNVAGTHTSKEEPDCLSRQFPEKQAFTFHTIAGKIQAVLEAGSRAGDLS